MKNRSTLAEEFMENGCLSSVPIIDTHTHMGGFYGSSLPRQELREMLGTMEQKNVEFIISAPNSALFDPIAGNQEIEEAMKSHPDKIRGYFVFNPNYPATLDQIERAFQENKGYVGFKILPDYHKTRLDSEGYKLLFQYADDHGLLVLSHTWGTAMDGRSYSSIDAIRNVTERYRNLKFLMGHSAQGECDEAIKLAASQENVYLELTDTYRLNGMIEKMCGHAGSEKVLFGTDLPWYNPAYCLGCILFAHISDEEKKNIIRNNIVRLLTKTDRNKKGGRK